MTLEVIELGSAFAETKGIKAQTFVDNTPQKQAVGLFRYTIVSGQENVM
jgi:hypothetical protein